MKALNKKNYRRKKEQNFPNIFLSNLINRKQLFKLIIKKKKNV